MVSVKFECPHCKKVKEVEFEIEIKQIKGESDNVK